MDPESMLELSSYVVTQKPHSRTILFTHIGAGSCFRVIVHRFDEGVHDSGCQVSPGLPGFAFAHGSSFAGFGLADAGLGVGIEEAVADAS